MQSIFNTADCEAFITRIQLLTADTKPQWGKMSAAQMLTHIQQPIKVGLGELKLKKSFMGFLFGKWVMNNLRKGKGFSKNAPTDKHFVIHDQPNFDREKQNAIEIIRRFSNGGPEKVTKEPHPFFGKMTAADWDILTVTHLNHHLTQFNV